MTSSGELRDFESVHRGESPEPGLDQRPPWSLGEPQPEIVRLIDEGKFHGEILDAGCGEAAVSLFLAQRGFRTVGLDQSPTAISSARAEADRRPGYLQSIVRAAAPGPSYYVLVFDGASVPVGPVNSVTAEELRSVVSEYWTVEEIRPSRIYVNIPHSFTGFRDFARDGVRDEGNGRKSIPAWPLSRGAPAADLARQLMLSPQAARTLVTRLHAAGHVEPVADANAPGRAIPMQVTNHGRTVLRQAAAEVDDVQEAFLQALSASERATLLKSLKKCLPVTRTPPGQRG